MIAIVATLHKKEDAVRIGKLLLEQRLIACYNLWPIESSYWWEGKIMDEPEVMMLIKTQEWHYAEVSTLIQGQSEYTVPDIFTLNPGQVHPAFNKWVDQETSRE